VSATKASVTTSYELNALGQRVKKTTSGSSMYFVYDEAGHLVGEYNNAGTLIQETVWFGDTPVATLRPNGSGVDVFYIHTDHLNTPRRVSRPSDNVVVWRLDSDPFGTTAVNEDPDQDSNLFVFNLRFPGQYFDAESGLQYNYYRDGYDPVTGRYTQSDPIGLDGGINTYAYIDGNPLSGIDPFGLSKYQPKNTVEAWCLRYPNLCKQQERELYNKLKRPKKPKTTGKEGAKDCPSWAKEDGGPMHNESGKDYAKRLLDEKYGPDGWTETGPGSEFSKIQKWADRAFD
jgi:RHS repeat-associated protein